MVCKSLSMESPKQAPASGGGSGSEKPENFSKSLTVDGLRAIVLNADTDNDQPRDEDGKFASGGAGGKGESEPVDLNVKPTVENLQLQRIVNDIYKGQGGKGQIGNGTMMDAVRNELNTGKPTKGRFHSKKARNREAALKKQISSGKLNAQEKSIARALIDDIGKALSGH